MAIRDFTDRFSAATLKRLSPSNWDRLIRELNTRFNDLEKIVPPLEAAEDLLLDIGLTRVNEVLAPAFESLEKLVDLGALLSATSTTNVTVQAGVIEFVVGGDPGQFAPAHNLVVTTPDEPSVAMQGTKVSYNITTGSLFINVTDVTGSGTYANWKIDIGLPPAILPADAEAIAYTPITGTGLVNVNNVADALDQLDVKAINAQSDIAGAQSDIGVLQTSVASAQANIAALDSDVTIVESSLSVVQADVSALKAPQYLALAGSGILSNERVVVAGNGVRVADAGAGGNFTFSADGSQAINLGLAVSAAAGALTIALKGANGSDPSSTNPVKIPFRNATGINGTPEWLSVVAAASLVVPSGATLGVTSSQAFRLWIVGFNDNGTFRLGVINCSVGGLGSGTIHPLTEWAVASSTLISAAAGNAGILYTDPAVTSKAYKILGFIEWSATGLTAGTWTTTNLNAIQLFGPGVPLPGQIVRTQSTVAAVDNSTSSTTYVTTSTNISMALASAANLVRVEAGGDMDSNGSAQEVKARLSRGSTNNTNLIGNEARCGGDQAIASFGALFSMDKPNVVGAQTYTVQFKRTAGTLTVGWGVADPVFISATELMG